jgi:hypothetical protein
MIRRYITCAVNLINVRFILLILGFFEFENNSYKFFERSPYPFSKDSLLKFTVYIGIANHTNIIDFLFYTYLLSPLYVRIIIVEFEDGHNEYMYKPLTYIEAYRCARTGKGFEPIIVKEREIGKIKNRKLKMSLLVV